MSIRADWHVGDLDLPSDGDPMQEIAEMTSGAVIDLSGDRGELEAELASLLKKEGRYFQYAHDDDGVTPLACDLKWSEAHALVTPGASLTCFTCPHYAADRASARSLICALGRRQHELVEHLNGLASADSLDAELCAAHERDIEADAELAEARFACV